MIDTKENVKEVQEVKIEDYTSSTLPELRQGMKRFKQRFETSITTAATDRGQKHLETVHSTLTAPAKESIEVLLKKATAMSKRTQRSLPQPVTYQEARQIFWAICTTRMQGMGKSFVVDATNKEIIQNLLLYFINDNKSTYNLKKGILLLGDVGTGKTFLLQSFATFAQITKVKRFKIAVCNEIVDDMLQRTYDGQSKGGINFKKYFNNHYAFDDIGDEAEEIKSYGNVIRPMDRIFTERYKRFVNGWCLTHGTTNLTNKEFEAKYGKRVYDRAKEMFNVISLTGDSRRG